MDPTALLVRRSAMGHGEAFLPNRPNAGYAIGKETVAWARGRGRDAPIAVVRESARRPRGPTVVVTEVKAYANSARSAFASFRSVVSKPSANQP